MKKSILLTLSAGMVLALSACTDAEMADFEQDVEHNMQDIQSMQRDCKNYITEKTELPMAAVRVSAGYGSNGRYTLPVQVKWDEPLVDERGECIVVNGMVRNYRITD